MDKATLLPKALVLKAGWLYFLILFALGFILGTIRVVLVVPRVGELAAVCIEVPLMLIASWFVSRWIVERTDLHRDIATLLAFGGSAFVFLMAGEFLLASLIFHRTPYEYLAGFRTLAGSIGLAGQIAFSLLPLAHRRA